MTLKDIFLQKANISDETIEAVGECCRPFEIKKGELLVTQGKICNFIFFISEGFHRVMHEKGDKEDTICFGGAGEVFLFFQSYMSREPALYSLYCLEDSAGWYISTERFKMLLQKYPDLQVWWGNMLASQMQSFEQLYSLFSLVDAEQRIENFWNICNPNFRRINSKQLFNMVPMKYLAQYIGITPQSLSRLRRKIMNARINSSREK